MDNNRLLSIDVFRALTMLLMIFVIDLGSVTDSPYWLDHAAADEDRMGLADIVLPCFMFIIGLSIPYAVKGRLARGESKSGVLIHILSRSLSLIIMGLFVVNMDNMHSESMIIKKGYWQALMVVSVLMIWNDYRSLNARQYFPKRLVQAIGWLLLGFLALIYKGPEGSWMQVYWWGILGLLGWSYGLCAAIYLFLGDRLIGLGVVVLAFLMLNINEFLDGWNWRVIVSASNYFSVMLGVFCTVIYTQLNPKRGVPVALGALFILALLLMVFGIITRPQWGISKIQATPSWSTVCAAISIFCFIVMVVVVDIQKHVAWAKFVQAGGIATLTCYFVLYFFYAVMDIVGFSWPQGVSSGVLGLIKSFCFALLVIQFAGWIGRLNMRLNI